MVLGRGGVKGQAQLLGLGGKPQEVLHGGGLAYRVAQQRRRVEGAHHQGTVFLDKLAVLLCHLKILLDQADGSHPADADDDGGAEDGGLVAQPPHTGCNLVRGGIPVLGRAALDHIGDVDVPLAGEAGVLQHLIHQLVAAPHKGLPLEVLVFPGAFAYQHDFCPWGAYAKHHVVPGGAKAAALALQHLLPQLLHILIHTMQHLPFLSDFGENTNPIIPETGEVEKTVFRGGGYLASGGIGQKNPPFFRPLCGVFPRVVV